MTNKMEGYTLYFRPQCPFCQKVLKVMQELDITIDQKDIADDTYRSELQAGGGKVMVPCLLHPDGRWQYESADIADFLKQQK